MKLHLPCGLLTAVLAYFGAVSSLSYGQECISVNFASGKESNNYDLSGETLTGIYEVQAQYWNNVSKANGTNSNPLKIANGTTTPASSAATLTWSSKETWEGKGTATAGDATMLKGYLDDGNGVSITVSGLEFLSYDVYVYTNTDTENRAYTAKTVNGVSYTYKDGATTEGTTAWGNSGSNGSESDEAKLGTNALYVTGQTSANLTITSKGNNQGPRGCISGIQIVDTYTGTKHSATLTENASWGTMLPDWADSSATNGAYASFTVNNESGVELTLGADRTTDAVMSQGGNLTISGENTLSLIGTSRLQAASGTTLTINSSLAGDVNVTGAGTVALKDLSGVSNVTVGNGATLQYTGTSTYDKGLKLSAGATVSSSDWFAGDLYLSSASYSSGTYNDLIGASKSLTIELSSGTLGAISEYAGAGGVTLVKTGADTATLNGSSQVAILNLDEGRLEIGNNVQIGTLNVASGTTVHTGWAVPLNADHINLNGGGKLSLDNGQTWGTSSGTTAAIINIQNTTEQNAVIAAGIYGPSTLNYNIQGTGTLELRQSEQGSLNQVYLNGVISGEVALLHTNGRYFLNKTNTYAGGTIIKGGNGQVGDGKHSVTAAADGALGTKAVTLVGNGTLAVNSGKVQTNTVYFNSDDTTAQATLENSSWEGGILTGAGISGGSITGGLLSVVGTHSLSNVTLNNVGVLVNGGTLTLTGAIEGSGSTIMVGSGATPLAEGDDATAPAGGTLDLSNVTTLSANINLMSGSTLILGDYLTNDAFTYTGSLNIEDGVIIDLSAWCKNTAEEPGDNLTVFQAWQPIFTYSGSDAEALNLLAGMDGRHVTIKLADYETQYGTLRYDAVNQSLLLVPEPTTATLSLLALAGLCARRRRK